MKAYALLGGPKINWPQKMITQLKAAHNAGNFFVGVDRGSLLLDEAGIVPDLAIGDFDSLKKQELTSIESQVADVRYSSPIKDLTDSELMLRAVFEDYHVNRLIVLGATGGRLDHELVNLFTFAQPGNKKWAAKTEIWDRQNLLRFYLPGKHQINKIATYPYFGIANLTPCQNLNIAGAQYELRHFSAGYPQVFASNEFKHDTNEFELSFDKGVVAVIFSKDLDRYQNIR